MESYCSAARRFFSELIHQHYESRYWHYGISLPASNSNSLAAYLKLNQEDYNLFLTCIGLIKVGRNGEKERISIQTKAWADFLIEENLDGNKIYFDRMGVNKVPVDGIDATESHVAYRGYWLGMGKYDTFHIPTTPLTQFCLFNKPPRITNRAKKLQELRLIIKSIRNSMVQNELDMNEEQDSDEECSTEAGSSESSASPQWSTTAITSSVHNLSSFLDDYKYDRRSKEETSRIIVESINESVREVTRRKHDMYVRNIMKNNEANSGGSSDAMDIIMKKEMLDDIELRERKVPVLAHFNIPLHEEVLQLIIREISLLSNMFVDKKILQYVNWKGKLTHLVPIPVCSSAKSFTRMNQRKRFIDDLPKYIAGSFECRKDNSKVAGWIMKRLGQIHEDEFIKVCSQLGLAIGTKRMDHDTSHAMWEEANVNSRSQRTILRYLHGTFGKRSIEIANTGTKRIENKNENIGKYEAIDPVSNVIDLEGERIHYWTKPLIPTISSSMGTRLKNNDSNELRITDIDNVDLVLGGDHGQRKFRMLIKIIVRKQAMDVIDEWTVKIAHIDCKKDTYKVLQQTIMPAINYDLREMKEKGIKLLVFKREEEDDRNTRYTYQLGKYDDNNDDLPSFVCPKTNIVVQGLKYVKSCTLRVVVTGDLAWYAAALGKVNMSSNWCTWCKLSANEWKDEGHEKGEFWTLENMRDLREKILTNEVSATSQNRKGVVDVELLPAVEIKQYIYPILHAEIGLGNYILNSFFSWVDYRIENVTEEEMDKKRLMKGIIEELESVEGRLNEFDKEELTDLKIDRANFKEVKELRNEYDRLAHTVEERKQLDVLLKEVNVSIKLLENELKELVAAVRIKRQVYTTLKSELDTFRTNRGKKGEVRILLENKLNDYGIHRPTYHGGDLTGVKIKVLLQSIDLLFNDFKSILIGVEDRLADNDEIDTIISMYSTMGFLVDGIFSLGRTRCGKLTEEVTNLTRRMVVAFAKMWRNLRLSMKGPKIHGMEDHLIEQMIQYGGIGCFCEDFVEQSHQYGVKEELRTRGLSRSRAFISHSKWEWNGNHLGVRKAREDIKRRTSRKRKRGSLESIRASKISRDDKRMTSLLMVERGDYEMLADYRKRI